jgi:cell division protease FtsH
MSEHERRLTAYHEAGHAVTSVMQPACDPIHKATIMPRGRALGMVVSLPEGDRVSFTREKAHADLIMAAGGRAAEEIIFGEGKVTSGASGDIEQMTRLSTAMVKEWGLSKKAGMRRYTPTERESMFGVASHSEETKQIVDKEIQALIDDGHSGAVKLLTEHRDKLEAVAQALLEFETLSGQEVRDLVLHGKPVVRAEMPAPVQPAPEDEEDGGNTPQTSSVPSVPASRVPNSGRPPEPPAPQA